MMDYDVIPPHPPIFFGYILFHIFVCTHLFVCLLVLFLLQRNTQEEAKATPPLYINTERLLLFCFFTYMITRLAFLVRVAMVTTDEREKRKESKAKQENGREKDRKGGVGVFFFIWFVDIGLFFRFS